MAPVLVGGATVLATALLAIPRLPAAAADVGINIFVVTSFVLVGIALLRMDLPPANGWACVLVAAATVAGGLNNVAFGWAASAGYVLEPLYLSLAAALVLRYPRAQLTHFQRRLVTALAWWSCVSRMLAAATAGMLPDGFHRSPGWPVLDIAPVWHDVIFVRVGRWGAVVLLLVGAALLVGQVRFAGGVIGRSLMPLAIIGSVCALAAAVDQAIWALDLTRMHWAAPALVRDLSAAALPIALLGDVLRRRAVAASIADRVLTAARGGDVIQVQTALRELLVDPQLAVHLYPAGVPAAEAVAPDAGGRTLHIIRLPDGSPLLRLDVDHKIAADEQILRAAIGAVGVASENLRLTSDLRARVAELEDSRARVVTASLAERRKVERDLHDGAQQRFLAVAAGLARADLVDDENLRFVVADARSGLMAALHELRDLARGIHPAALSQGGLPAAIPGLAGAMSLNVSIEVDPELGKHRPPQAVESAVFFVVAEALGNAVRHAGARNVTISVTRDHSTIHATIRDDGSGQARLIAGGGLAGLADRVEAFSGTFDVHNDPCRRHPTLQGTTVHADLPVKWSAP